MHRKEFFTEGGIPVIPGTNISKVGQLHDLADLGICHNRPKSYSFLHKFELYTMCGSLHTQQLPLFLVLNNLIVEVALERVYTVFRVERQLNLFLLLGVYAEFATW